MTWAPELTAGKMARIAQVLRRAYRPPYRRATLKTATEENDHVAALRRPAAVPVRFTGAPCPAVPDASSAYAHPVPRRQRRGHHRPRDGAADARTTRPGACDRQPRRRRRQYRGRDGCE